MTRHHIAVLVELGEAEAYRSMFAGTPDELNISAHRVGSAIALVAPAFPEIIFNRVIGLGLMEPVTDTMLDDIHALYGSAGLGRYAVQLSPEAQPETSGRTLLERGFVLRDNWAKTYRVPYNPQIVPCDFRIDRVGPEHAGQFGELGCQIHGMHPSAQPMLAGCVGLPGCDVFMASDGDTPVAVAMMMRVGGAGWLGVGGTLPAYRNRGAQSALLAERIGHANRLGYTHVITETGEETAQRPNPSFRNMVRAGFQVAYHRPNYIVTL